MVAAEDWSTLLDALGCGAGLIARDGRIIHLNQRLYDMLRLPAGSLEGASVYGLYASDPEAGRFLTEALAIPHGECREGEFYLPRPDGSRLPVIASYRTLSGGAGVESAVVGQRVVITVIDITSQVEARQSMASHMQTITELSDTALQQALALKHQAQQLEQRVRERTAEIHRANLDAIYMLAVASEAKDTDTGAHVLRLQAYARALATGLGFGREAAEAMGQSAVLHDVGKMHVPDRILQKAGPLDDSERQVMQEHTLWGERILSGGSFFEQARRIARWHHENHDGTGYPDRRSGDAIPIEAAIVHVVDVFDALSMPRVYKAPWPIERVRQHMVDHAGRHFHPQAIREFVRLIDDGDIAAIGRQAALSSEAGLACPVDFTTPPVRLDGKASAVGG